MTDENQNQGAPAWDDDPIGHLKHRNDQLEGLARELITERQLSSTRQQLNHAVTDMAREYEREVPDFKDAMEFGLRKEIDRYKASGLNDYEAQQMVERDLENVSIQELRANKNPAARLYEIAQQLGYGTPESEPKPQRALPDLDDEQFQKYWQKMQDRNYPGGRAR